MDKLRNIGFYTLEDFRAANCSHETVLWRCELILTSRCNFNCPYCRGMKDEDKGDMSWEEATYTLDKWCDEGLRHVRFSGGEPTLWKRLPELCQRAHNQGVRKIAISTNGSADFEEYKYLMMCGVNDFSISLDSCCSSTSDKMAGRSNVMDKIVSNIKQLSEYTYVTVGVVITEDNVDEINQLVEYASNLGVSDIRLITAAQTENKLSKHTVDKQILKKHPILNYRLNNFKENKVIRGINESDCHKCSLVLDDMAVMNGKHYPCIIYMREHGEAIGNVTGDIRQERLEWFKNHNTFVDKICSKNCLDVCVDYNNRVRDINPNLFEKGTLK